MDLDPRQNYVLGFHPHGILVAGAFTNFCTQATGFSKLFPGLESYLLRLPLWFRAPFFRDYIMCAGQEPARLSGLRVILNTTGHSLHTLHGVINTGGPSNRPPCMHRLITGTETQVLIYPIAPPYRYRTQIAAPRRRQPAGMKRGVEVRHGNDQVPHSTAHVT